MIEISNLNFRYESNITFSLQNISLKFSDGKVIGILGHNGAGKSTLIKLICGILEDPSASIRNDGKSVSCSQSEMLHTLKIGYAPDNSELDPDLTAKDVLELTGAIRGMNETDIAAELDLFIKTFQMEDWYKNTLAKKYSLGMKKKVSLGIALFGNVRYAILDEPFNGLDPVACYQFKKLLADKKGKGCGIMLSSHMLEVVEGLIDSVLILNQGQPIFNDSLEELKRQHPHCKDLEEIYYHMHTSYH
ncbi:MAG: ABC transporter ATP-binding protein [Fibrobacteres bacterium]|nr:ABC transporter ATP-binding protein [Fibrobacterota bacterium]